MGILTENIYIESAHHNAKLVKLNYILNNKLTVGSKLFVPELRHISTSIQSFLKLQEIAKKKGFHLIILDLMNKIETNFEKCHTFAEQLQMSLAALSELESDQRKRLQSRAIKVAQNNGQNLGRPPKVKPEKIKQIGSMRQSGNTVSEIAESTGLSQTTIYRILKRLRQ